MANLYAGDRVYSIDDGYYGVIVQNFSDMGYEYANIELGSKITERYTRTKERLIKLHPEDQFSGKIELNECTDQYKTIAELQKEIDRLRGRYSGMENTLDVLKQRVGKLEQARQQDVENSRQMKKMLMSMVKQWEAEDEQERK